MIKVYLKTKKLRIFRKHKQDVRQRALESFVDSKAL